VAGIPKKKLARPVDLCKYYATDRSISFLSPPRSDMTALIAPPAMPAPTPPVSIRPLEPPDAALLDTVLEGMSAQSRYTRFHGPKPRLSSSERAYLADADGRDHLALVALDPAGAPLGIARGVRLRDDPGAAEIAAEVVDAWQRRGLGTTLLARLARQAVAVGIARFTATVLAQSGLQRALRRRGWRTTATDGLTVTLEIDVWAMLRPAL
jgi:GNAT superfamily N-acetyltransferase